MTNPRQIQWHMVLAIAMHKLGLNSIDISPGDVAAYSIAHNEAGLVYFQTGEVVTIKLISKHEAQVLATQIETPRDS